MRRQYGHDLDTFLKLRAKQDPDDKFVNGFVAQLFLGEAGGKVGGRGGM